MKELMRVVRSLPQLGKEEEEVLWERSRGGDIEARNRLALRYVGIVFKVAKTFRWSALGHEDIFQEGFFGLLAAIDTWDPASVRNFVPHAYWRIYNRVIRTYWVTGHMIRPKDMEKESVVETVSLSSPVGNDLEGKDRSLENQLPCEVPGLDDVVEERNTAAILEEALRSLPEKEEAVLRRFYGFGFIERSMDAIGEELGCSRQRVHQVEQKALARLRRKPKIRALAPC